MPSSRATIRDKLEHVKAFALDLDGTVYLGDKLLPGALQFLETLQQLGFGWLFVTNNSSRSSAQYFRKLSGLGLPVRRDQIYTSGDATASYLNRLGPRRKLYLLGTGALHDDFQSAGFQTRSKNPDFVVLGFDTDLTYRKLDAACRFIRSGVPFVATHPDFNCPLPAGDAMPDCGSIAAAITAATGVQPTVIGKPEIHMIRGMERRLGVEREHIAILGDRLMTDIRAGHLHGMTTILVLTGETRLDDLEQTEWPPTLVVSDLLALQQSLQQTG